MSILTSEEFDNAEGVKWESGLYLKMLMNKD